MIFPEIFLINFFLLVFLILIFRLFCLNIPILLVGCKLDLRDEIEDKVTLGQMEDPEELVFYEKVKICLNLQVDFFKLKKLVDEFGVEEFEHSSVTDESQFEIISALAKSVLFDEKKSERELDRKTNKDCLIM